MESDQAFVIQLGYPFGKLGDIVVGEIQVSQSFQILNRFIQSLNLIVVHINIFEVRKLVSNTAWNC